MASILVEWGLLWVPGPGPGTWHGQHPGEMGYCGCQAQAQGMASILVEWATVVASSRHRYVEHPVWALPI